MLVKKRPVKDLICEGKKEETVLKNYEDTKVEVARKAMKDGWKEQS